MVKYINAELYKVTHRRVYTWLSLGLILAGETLFLLLLRFTGNDPTYGDVLYLLPMMMMAGLYLTVMLCDIVFSDQYKLNTLKNEVSYGIPRWCIYLGKLLAAIVTAVAFCAVILVFYVGLGRLMFPEDVRPETIMTLGELFENAFQAVGAAFPLWLGALGFGLMLLFVTKGSTMATVIFVIVMGPLDTILQLIQMFVEDENVIQTINMIRHWLLCNGFNAYGTFDMAHNWIMGMAWFLISTSIGLVVFQKREIN